MGWEQKTEVFFFLGPERESHCVGALGNAFGRVLGHGRGRSRNLAEISKQLPDASLENFTLLKWNEWLIS